jgi:hypothetical protein
VAFRLTVWGLGHDKYITAKHETTNVEPNHLVARFSYLGRFFSTYLIERHGIQPTRYAHLLNVYYSRNPLTQAVIKKL